MCSISSIRPYLLWDKFVVIHYRKARNPDEFPFYGNISLDTRSNIPPRSMMWDSMYLMTNLIIGQPSTSNLCINFRSNVSFTSQRFRTKYTHNVPSGKCYANNYRYRTPADCSCSLKLKKGKNLEVQVGKDNDDELLVLVLTMIHQQTYV